MEELKISVIVPIYNVEKYFKKCIDSIISQTYKNLEIILIDDQSPDNCPQICEEYKKKDSRIRVIHKLNGGLGFARNSGLEIAEGKYVLFVDSDDYIDINMIQKLYNKLIETNSDTVFCGLNKVYSNSKIEKVPAIYDNVTFYNQEIIDKVLLEMVGSNPEENEDTILYMSVWHALYSMNIIRENNIRFPSERNFMSEDISFHIDYLRYAKTVTYISDCFYYYRFNNNSLSKSYDPTRFKRQKELHLQILDKLSLFLNEDQYLMREQRRFLGGVRGRILDIVKYENNNKLQNIKNITEDEILIEILKSYPVNKNPFKHRIFNCFLKHKLIILLYIMSKIQIQLKRN